MVAIINRYIQRTSFCAEYLFYFGSSLHNRGSYMVLGFYRRWWGSSPAWKKVQNPYFGFAAGSSASYAVSVLSLCWWYRYGSVYRYQNSLQPLLHFALNYSCTCNSGSSSSRTCSRNSS